MTAPLTVALCDDHAMLRAGLRRLLGDEADLAVIGESGTAEEAVAMARLEKPDVFVLDLGLPGKNGIVAIRQIREVSPSTRILVLTMHDDVAYLREAFAAGASGYLVKRAADVELVLAVRAVAAGERYVHPSLGAALLEGTSIPPGSSAGSQDQLSQREAEILRLLAVGHTNAEIARNLHLSVRTIETHRAHVQQNFGFVRERIWPDTHESMVCSADRRGVAWRTVSVAGALRRPIPSHEPMPAALVARPTAPARR